jgi:putative transposase
MARRPPRLTGFDYARPGAYFVTICTHGRACLLSEVRDFQVRKTQIGEVVSECWLELPSSYSFVELDVFIVMPNHFHGILWIGEENLGKKSLGQIIASFKARSASRILKEGLTAHKVWQSDFFEHIVRTEKDLIRIREYIANNPENWANDHNNPSYSGGYISPFEKYENVMPTSWLRPKSSPR